MKQLIKKYISRIILELIKERKVRSALTEALMPLVNYRMKKATRISQERTETLPMKPKAEYDIFTTNDHSFVWGLLEVGNLRPGDTVDIRLYVPVGDSEPKRTLHWVLDGQQKDPVFMVSQTFLPAGSKYTVEQSKGRSKEIDFSFHARRA